MIPDPLKEWYADASKQQQLLAALNSSIFKEATTLLRQIALPKSYFTDRTSAEAITHAAMEQNRNAGFFSYEDELWQLTEPPKQPPKRPDGYSESYVISWAKAHGMWEEFQEKAAEPTNQ